MVISLQTCRPSIWLIFVIVVAAVSISAVKPGQAEQNFEAVHHTIPGCRVAVTQLRNPQHDFKFGICVGTIKGLIGAQKVYQSLGHRALFCGDETTSIGDYVSAFVAYVDANPSMLSRNFTGAVLTALSTVFPCPVR